MGRTLESINENECVVDGQHYISSTDIPDLRKPCATCAIRDPNGMAGCCNTIGEYESMRCSRPYRTDGCEIIWIPKPTETVVQPKGEIMCKKPGVTVAYNPNPLPEGVKVVHIPLTRSFTTQRGGIRIDTTETGYATFVAIPNRSPHGYWIGASFCEPGDTFNRTDGTQRALDRALAASVNEPIGYSMFLSHHVFSHQSLHNIAWQILDLDLLGMPEWCVRTTKAIRREEEE